MFDVSLIELAVIGLVALLVLGPEKLPRAARTVGLYARKARQTWYSVRADIERELAADELRRSLQRSESELRETVRLTADAGAVAPTSTPAAAVAPERSDGAPPAAPPAP